MRSDYHDDIIPFSYLINTVINLDDFINPVILIIYKWKTRPIKYHSPTLTKLLLSRHK